MTDSRNLLLREHLTRVGFDLSLGKTQIAALVALDIALDRGTPLPTGRQHFGRNILSSWATAVHGLIDRGLVLHHWTKDPKTGHAMEGLRHHYTITRAGDLVLELLEEAGLYEEYVATVDALERPA